MCLPVQYICVKSGVHALPWAPSREGITPTKHHVEHTECNEVVIIMGTALQADNQVSKLGEWIGALAHVR